MYALIRIPIDLNLYELESKLEKYFTKIKVCRNPTLSASDMYEFKTALF